MKKIYIIVLIIELILTYSIFGQSTISGKVLDENGKGLSGANVSIKGSYDGATTNTEGLFKFKTFEKAEKTLLVSFIGYEVINQKILLVDKEIILTLKMKEAANELNTVTITAGSFEASDEKKTTLIKPIDIVTTAGGGADITQTMTLLTPGSQRNGESTGMFVRGGSAQESKILIDGLTIQNAYNSPSPDVASRSRFAPFQFKGSAFSTGGYSAQYGQALSAVLQMNTTDLADKSETVINANLAQISIGKTQLSDNHSITGTLAYNNLTPLFAVYPQNINWIKIPRQMNASISYRLKPSVMENFKIDAVYGKSASGLKFANPDLGNSVSNFSMNNNNLLITSSYQKALDKDAKWVLKSGLAYAYNMDDAKFGSIGFGKKELRAQGRTVFIRSFEKNTNLLIGTELHHAKYELDIDDTEIGGKKSINTLNDNYGAIFAESEFYISRKLAGRIGIRSEYSSLANAINIAPRISMAYKTGQFSQVSFAGGKFYQTPDYQYYFFNKNLSYENANHAVLNYQIIKNKRTFRLEGYYKKYSNLVREFSNNPNFYDANPQRFPNGRTDNSGNGFAQGVDVFFRDSKTFKNGDLWVNYSYCDSKRLFGNYLTETQPTFVSNNNLNIIYKHFIEKPTMTVSATYSYTSGRPYYNPNTTSFLSEKTPDVHNTSLWINYLTNIKGHFTVIYFSVDNILGTKNIFNYRYAADGKSRVEIRPAANRMIMLGTFITISKKKELPQDMRKN